MKIKTIGVLCALVAAVSFGVSKSNAIELVVNGGFETGSLAGWTLTPNTIPFGTTPGVQMSGVSHSGDWAVALGNYPQIGFLTQTLRRVPLNGTQLEPNEPGGRWRTRTADPLRVKQVL